jgi:hypothetical protein
MCQTMPAGQFSPNFDMADCMRILYWKMIAFVLLHQNTNISIHRWHCHYLFPLFFLLSHYSIQKYTLVVSHFITSCSLELCVIPIKVTSERLGIEVTNHAYWTSLPLLLRLQILLEIHVSFLFNIISYMCIIILKINFFLCLLTIPRRLMEETVYSALLQVQ